MTAVVEIGRAVNPLMVAGQVEGGTAQGLGYALLEEVVLREGRMANAQLTNYLVPTTLDTPAHRRDDPREPVPARALRGQGRREMPMSGPGRRWRTRCSTSVSTSARSDHPEKVLECASSSTAGEPTSTHRR